MTNTDNCWVTAALKDKHKSKKIDSFMRSAFNDSGLHYFMEYEDVRQDILTRVYKMKDLWRGDCSDTSFVYKVARNHCTNLWVHGTRMKRDFRRTIKGPSDSTLESWINGFCDDDSGDFMSTYAYSGLIDDAEGVDEDSPEKLAILGEDLKSLDGSMNESEREVFHLFMEGFDRSHLQKNMKISYLRSSPVFRKLHSKLNAEVR